MPMILLTVPSGTSGSQLKLAEEEIKKAARSKGVEGGITVWPLETPRAPGRLLLEYKSRQEVEDPSGLAKALAEAAEHVFRIQVEAAIIKLDPKTTGLHITSAG